jgi:gliding motility-associated protein GldM
MIQYLYDRTDANDITVNRMSAYVIPRSESVPVGGRYEAQLLLAGIDTLQQPEYYVNGQKIGNDGLYSFTASGVGEHSFSGVIKYRNNAGEPVEAHFSQRYVVVEGDQVEVKMPEKQDKLTPNVAITNRDLAVVYKGYPHTFMITSTTVPAAQLSMSASGATVSKISPGLFRVVATNAPGSEVTINVSGTYQGKSMSLGSEKFRVKKLPKPHASLSSGGKELTGGRVGRKQLVNQAAEVTAGYGEDAIINANFTVTGFQIYADGRTAESKSSHFTGEQMQLLNSLSKGSQVTFLSIQAVGPGGVRVPARSLSFIIN